MIAPAAAVILVTLGVFFVVEWGPQAAAQVRPTGTTVSPGPSQSGQPADRFVEHQTYRLPWSNGLGTDMLHWVRIAASPDARREGYLVWQG
jgi:hypothetical protein